MTGRARLLSCRRQTPKHVDSALASSDFQNGISSSVIGPAPALAGSASGVRWSKLLPPPAAAPRELAKSPPPPPSPRPPSSTRSLATTSVMYFFCPLVLSSQERV